MMLLGNRTPHAVQDSGLVLARLVLGGVFIAHGWQKVAEFGIDATATNFDAMGIPLPEAAAIASAGIELGGGAFLLLGLLTPLASLLLAANMAGAWWYAHREAGLFVTEGGWELVLVLGVAALVIGMVGPGRLSLDALLGRRSKPSEPAAA